jgi:hypothetical protein
MDIENIRGHRNNYNTDPDNNLKRVSIEPEEKMERLERHEIGIRSGMKGAELKDYIDRVVYKLVYQRLPKVTLKAIGIFLKLNKFILQF